MEYPRIEPSVYDKAVIAKAIREWLKDKYSDMKWSVSKKDSTIFINLMEAPSVPIREGEYMEDFVSNGYTIDINPYYISDTLVLTDEYRKVFEDVKAFSDSYNWDKSDPMTDYFNVNFYLNLRVGKQDKPFKVVQRKKKSTPRKKKQVQELEPGDITLNEFILLDVTKNLKSFARTKYLKNYLGFNPKAAEDTKKMLVEKKLMGRHGALTEAGKKLYKKIEDNIGFGQRYTDRKNYDP
jgi:hypothetical protein